ncbi:penicillin-binding protein 2 [Paracrocinitomix mangrovi]|uniref:peptidoglycan D,D-transpeptidase FtsI family protein n=1 Tax=Paracrocinitomix mangrovi TaxID=2862509 RepID=UPI001C8ECD05|nr:penicillin-binding transpeptidase domain-containing protein [Paracrocinitomix mangrovi]UKN00684.1 penicillin-binding protein 2 [Paracrocinitomix mangrovi]
MNNIDNRKYVIALIFTLIPIIFIVRLFFMQVVDDKWKERAAQISENKVVTYPARGIVYDRNNKKLISNEVYYDIRVIPGQTDNPDSVSFAKLLDISLEEYTEQMNKARDYSMRKPSDLVKQIPPDEFADIAPELYKYPGFYEVERTLRIYPRPVAAHVLGYMAEVDSNDIKRDPYYASGDIIGKSGIEKSYEELLRGKKGVKYYLQDAIGLETGRYEDGNYDTLAEQGKNITLTIDGDLQEYGEKLMQNKRGAIVAIEPATGEILTMISSPSYDPNLLVGRRLGKNWGELTEDTLKPLYNRATQARYNPGSTFKLLMALIAMQEGVIDSTASFPCTKDLVGCHNHPTARGVSDGVKMSCNPYFYYLTRKIIQQGKYKSHFKDAAYGLDIWADYLYSFGLDKGLNVDFPAVTSGRIPNTDFYNNEFPSKSRPYGEYAWAFSTIYSNSIGQGEVELTPLELANVACVMANRGHFYYPHFIKEIEDGDIPEIYRQRQDSKVEPKYFGPVIDGMWRVVHEAGGTASRARVDSLDICGKTGTAENFKVYGGKRRQLKDHSIFIAFAPRNNPKIAISVYIENSGFGGTWAAPIASLLIEKYITGEIKDKAKEQRILEADLMPIEIMNYKKNR